MPHSLAALIPLAASVLLVIWALGQLRRLLPLALAAALVTALPDIARGRVPPWVASAARTASQLAERTAEYLWASVHVPWPR